MARARDPNIDDRIMGAARELADEGGFDAVTISAVAARASVGRPTVYRRWRTRAALVFELQTHVSVPTELPDLGSFRADLYAAVLHLAMAMAIGDRSILGEHLAAMIDDEDFAHEVWSRRWRPDRVVVGQLWTRAVDRGEVDPGVDGDAFIDDLVAMCMFRVLLAHEPPDPEWVTALVDRAIDGVVADGSESAPVH